MSRTSCTGELVCGLVKRQDGREVVNSQEIRKCGAHQRGRVSFCGLVRFNVRVEPGKDRGSREEKREPSLYEMRLLPLMKEETKIQFQRRMLHKEDKNVPLSNSLGLLAAVRNPVGLLKAMREVGFQFDQRNDRFIDAR
jgi:hypothetical protein